MVQTIQIGLKLPLQASGASDLCPIKVLEKIVRMLCLGLKFEVDSSSVLGQLWIG